ncbi:MAG: hypothetical protein Q8L36_01385 [bacterium]|nr:hypothetical protein [bacterium]
MKKERIFGLVILTGGALLAAFLLFSAASAQEANIIFPISELGNCGSKEECKTYCDDSANVEACLNFAEKNNLMSKKEIDRGRQFAKSGGTGPGGCRGQECEKYCDDISKIEECVAFAEKNNLVPANELAEMKKVRDAVKNGVKPPACRNKEECDSYCSLAEHMEECITFAQAAGMMPKEEGEKVLNALRQGIKPPACRGPEECDQYCSSEEHLEECLKFSEAAGFMKPEDAAMARKTGGKGPGGCRGKGCENFCQKSENQETCFNFAKENGLMNEQELKEIEGHKQEMSKNLLQMPPEILSCLEQTIGADKLGQLKSGQGMPTREIGDQMRSCFEQNRDKLGPPPGEGKQGEFNGEFRSGPGNCQSPEECQAYCQNNPQECRSPGGEFGPQQGGEMNRQFPGEQKMESGQEFRPGPGGCQSPEECQNFCQGNPESCRDFGQNQQDRNNDQPMMRQIDENNQFPINEEQRQRIMERGQNQEGAPIGEQRFVFPNQQQVQQMIQRREGEQMMPENFQGNPEQFRQMMENQQPPEGFQPQQQMNFQQAPQEFQQQQQMMEFRPPEGGQQGPLPGGDQGMMSPQGARPVDNFFSQIISVFTNILKPAR